MTNSEQEPSKNWGETMSNSPNIGPWATLKLAWRRLRPRATMNENDITTLIEDAAQQCDLDLDRVISLPVPERNQVWLIEFRTNWEGNGPHYLIWRYEKLPEDNGHVGDSETHVLEVPEEYVGFLASLVHAAQLHSTARMYPDVEELKNIPRRCPGCDQAVGTDVGVDEEGECTDCGRDLIEADGRGATLRDVAEQFGISGTLEGNDE